MSDEYPLYPELSEAGREEAQRLIDKFKKKMKEAADEVLGELYVDVACFIESDSWTNFRNALLDGLRGYKNRKVQAGYDFKKIREKIYFEYRDEIIKDLDQDNLKKIAELEKINSGLHEMLSRN